MSVFPRVHMPSLAGATGWLNSEPPGRVVVLNFWTLTCINWLRTEPGVRAITVQLAGSFGPVTLRCFKVAASTRR
jgi:hypothetical protein